MKTPLLAFLIMIALIVGSAVTVNMACETGDHTWCVSKSAWHHTIARAPR
jgi:hypothetical protein